MACHFYALFKVVQATDIKLQKNQYPLAYTFNMSYQPDTNVKACAKTFNLCSFITVAYTTMNNCVHSKNILLVVAEVIL